jgi:predicted ribosomally synthesized peptide with nif11-like leader
MGVAAVAWLSRHPADTRLRMGDTGGTTSHPLQAMSEEQHKAFLEAVKADAGLQEKLKAAGDVDAVVEIAKAAGFVISAEELKNAAQAGLKEVSEEELEGVAGGGIWGHQVGSHFCYDGR